MRRGISLLEVLFAIFVLAVGLLGLAAMVPVGKHEVTEASHADRAVAIGTDALKTVKIRDYLDEETWVAYNFGTGTFEPFAPANPHPAPFIVDPIGVAFNVTSGSPDTQYGVFPYGSANFQSTAPPLARLSRISVADVAGTTPASVALADRVFRAVDDLSFELPADETSRPILVNSTSSAQTQSSGDYSWLFMVSFPDILVPPPSPAPPPLPPWPPLTPPPLNKAAISAVVFHKRDVVVDTSAGAVPSERTMYLDLVNGGLGGSFGGDAQLRATGLTTPPTGTLRDYAEKVVKVRKNQWILVSGQLTSGAPVHKWYRVAATTDMHSTADPWIADLTLAGPDWNASGFRDMDADASNGPTMYATICDGVVGVFEKVIQLDEPSLWSSH